jgi:hypothetical protein
MPCLSRLPATDIFPSEQINTSRPNRLSVYNLFVRLISHQSAVLFSHNKPATSNQPAVLFSQNKSAPTISHQPNEQAASRRCLAPLYCHKSILFVTQTTCLFFFLKSSHYTQAPVSGATEKRRYNTNKNIKRQHISGNQPLHANYENFNLSYTMLIQRRSHGR